MSSVSEQDHLNPRDPLYYAPRWLRERSASMRDGSPEGAFVPATTFDHQLQSAVSDALRHPLDPEIMREPESDSKRAIWTITARFAAAVGVSAAVALFFVVVVPGSRQGDAETSAFSSVAQSLRAAFQPKDAAPKPAIAEFQAILASSPPAASASSEQSGHMLKQFMQWQDKPNPATPQRTNP